MTERTVQEDSLIGRELDGGRYEIRAIIGHGGMGSVYLAHQRSVDRRVAIKFIHPRMLVDENLKLRFHREAKAMASLSSPHCATVFDYGETDDGHLYIVMEYLQGQSLSDIIKSEGPLSFDTFLDWFRQACAGVQAAHRQGLIHRDLKPENIFVASGSDGTRIKILDFGLAKILRGADGTGETQGRPDLAWCSEHHSI